MNITWHGILTVTKLELAQRVRSKKLYVALAGWFVLIGAITALVIRAFQMSVADLRNGPSPGPMAFAIITYVVLGLALIITPAFTATSINGDRQAGTLALLQATRLSAGDLATGKLLAAWLTGLAFLVVATPFIAWSMVLGNISVLQVLVCFAVMFALVAVVSAVGLGWSAIIGRPAGSTVLTYVTVVVLTVIAPMVMVLGIQVSQEQRRFREWGLPPAVQAEYQAKVDRYYADVHKKASGDYPAPPIGQCAWKVGPPERTPRPDRWAWMLVPNPFVVVADAAPLPPEARDNVGAYSTNSADGLALVSYGVRHLLQAPSFERDSCMALYDSNPAFVVKRDSEGNVISVTTSDGTPVNVSSPVKQVAVTTHQPLWPWGLGFNVALGAAFFLIAVRRLTVPYGVLPKGTRVA